jgi:predicted helicase
MGLNSTKEKGDILELTMKLYFQELGFNMYLWQEWASKRRLLLQDTGVDLLEEKDGKVYVVQHKNWEREVSWKYLETFVGFLRGRLFSFLLEMSASVWNRLRHA